MNHATTEQNKVPQVKYFIAVLSLENKTVSIKAYNGQSVAFSTKRSVKQTS